MRISLIAAVAENRVIGRGGRLPWHLPADLKHFKRTTAGHVVVMGRRTYESLDGPLPDRRSIVVTRNRAWRAEGAEVAHDLDAALRAAAEARETEVFILGGAGVFAAALPRADRLYLTLVHAEPDGDTYFPEIDLSEWTLLHEQRHEADQRHAYPFSIRVYERRESVEAAPGPTPPRS